MAYYMKVKMRAHYGINDKEEYDERGRLLCQKHEDCSFYIRFPRKLCLQSMTDQARARAKQVFRNFYGYVANGQVINTHPVEEKDIDYRKAHFRTLTARVA